MLLITVLTYILLNVLYTQQAEENSVIVIGAGSSGIAATAKLLENGVNVTLLEAENRIGGRIFSIFFGDAFVDLGAEWCHGEGATNVVYELVKDMGLLKHSSDEFQMYTSDRGLVDDNLNVEIHDIFDEIYMEENSTAKEGQTKGEYFLERYKDEIDEAFGNDKIKYNFSLEAIELMHRYVLSEEGAFNWHDVSAIGDFAESPGDLNLNWNGMGYKTILEVLMKKFPKPDPNFNIDEVIRLNSKVHKIIWNKEDGVSLEIQGGRKYTAKYVIFTGSLGVLKDSHEELFTPSLPEEKKDAIQKLGIAAVMKVMMNFPVNFWDTDGNFTGYTFMWTEEDRKILKAGKTPWLEDFFSVVEVEKNDKVLSAWFTGSSIPEIERLSDGILIDGIVFALNKFFGSTKTVVPPNRIARYNWYSNPNYRGTYSFQTIESRKLNNSPNSILSQPLINEKTGKAEVIFAGEATSPIHYSTVHGAIESGYRAAEEVLKAIGKI